MALRGVGLASLLLVALPAFFFALACSSSSSDRYVGRGALDERGGTPRGAEESDEGRDEEDRARGADADGAAEANLEGFDFELEVEPGESAAPENGDEAGRQTVHRDSEPRRGKEPEPLDEEEIHRLEELASLLEYSDEADELQQDIARKAEEELVKMGPAALPHLRRLARGERALAVGAVKLQIRLAHPEAVEPSTRPEERRTPGAESTAQPEPERPADAEALLEDAQRERGDLLRSLLEDDSLAGTRVDVEAVADFLLVRMREMERAAARLDYDRALELGEAILTLAPQMHLRDELESLLAGYREAKLQSSLLGGRVACLEPEVSYGEEIPFRVVLKNLSDRTLTVYFTRRIPRSRAREDVYVSPVQLRVAFTQIAAATGSRMTRSESVRLTAEGEVQLEPGEVWSKEWTLDTTTLGGHLEALGEVEVSGRIRPLRVTSERGDETARQIELEPATARIRAAGYDRAHANPRGELERALRGRDSVDVVIVAYAARSSASEAERWEIIGMLLDELGRSGRQMRRAIFSALQAITADEINFGHDERHWRMWYEANRPG